MVVTDLEVHVGEIVEAEIVDLPKELAKRERLIQRGLKTFAEVGVALGEIRDQQLYQDGFKTFDQYCSERWGFKRRHAYDMIAASVVVKGLCAIAHTDTDAPPTILPGTESQARALVGLEPAVAQQVLQAAHDATEGKVTAVAIKKAREALAPKTFTCADCDGKRPWDTRIELTDDEHVCEDCADARQAADDGDGDGYVEPEQPQPKPAKVSRKTAKQQQIEDLQNEVAGAANTLPWTLLQAQAIQDRVNKIVELMK